MSSIDPPKQVSRPAKIQTTIIPDTLGKNVKVCKTCHKLMLDIFGLQEFNNKKYYFCSEWCWKHREIKNVEI